MWLGASLRGAAADDVFGGLMPLGEPPGGWWEQVARLHASSRPGVRLALPRPGDPRGVQVPHGMDGEGAVGCGAGRHVRWLIAHANGEWVMWDDHGGFPRPSVPAESADRDLRAAVVEAAHALDSTGTNPLGQGLPTSVDMIVDAWLLHGDRLPAPSRRLAAAALPMLVAAHAVTSPHAPGGITAHETQRLRNALRSVEPAARTALESAYSTAPLTDGDRDR